MYEAYFGLKRAPFGLAADPDFLFAGPQHREALAGMAYAMLARKGLVVLTGDPGTGKTTLISRLLAYAPVTQLRAVVIINPILTPDDFLEFMLMNLGLEPGNSKAQRLWQLRRFLEGANQNNATVAIIVDEAHKLSPGVLEEIRLLGNFEAQGNKLLQLVLAGQTELDMLLDRPELWQLKQRIALRLTLSPFSAADAQHYIGHRWIKAGGRQHPFDAAALNAIYVSSRGIPRLINSICDNALTHAFAGQQPVVELKHVVAACRDLRLTPQPGNSAAAAAAAAAVVTPALQVIPALPQPVASPISSVQAPAANGGLQASLGRNGDRHSVASEAEQPDTSFVGRWVGRLGWGKANS